ncbi:signal peptide peptidase SppA [Oceanidesulfovibrio indonesiensis]|nr:signal peptide peptidase SppA [Oceanidesulfovibrio indonesiensis]
MKARAPRAVNALVGEVWALEPNKMEQVADIAQAMFEGRAGNGELFAKLAGESGKSDRPYAIVNQVAVVPVNGVIARRMNMFQSFSGGCSTELVGKQIRQAANDDDVRAIVLDIDSPGGAVFGLNDLAGTIASVRSAGKPVVAHTSELMCSAAYWIGSAAEEMICTADAQVGSIGVAAMHFDYSERDRKEGVRRTVLYAGHYKRLASDEKPLSEEGREYLQERVDHYYSLFVDAVARHRGMSAEEVLEKLADGSTHIGHEAQKRGFVHSIGNLDAAISRALELSESPNQQEQEEHMSTGTSSAGDTDARGGDSGVLNLSSVTADQLSAANPELAAELGARGASAERARVVELFEAQAGAEMTLEAVKSGADPKDFYKAALAAERKGQADALAEFEKTMSGSAGQDGKDLSATAADGFEGLIAAHMDTAKCSKGDAIIAVARRHPDAHAAWLAGKNQEK